MVCFTMNVDYTAVKKRNFSEEIHEFINNFYRIKGFVKTIFHQIINQLSPLDMLCSNIAHKLERSFN